MKEHRKGRSTRDRTSSVRAPGVSLRALFHEPQENDRLSAANEALERLDECIRTVLDAGGEFALRQRLQRILPAGILTSEGTAPVALTEGST
jgi:hypothetical protein